MMHFVTGATGFVGRRLCNQLAVTGDQVRALCRDVNTDLLDHPNIEKVKGDIRDGSSLTRAMSGCDSCFHLAALAAQWHPRESSFEDVNVRGTENVINAVQVQNVKRLVFTSTAGVLGASQNRASIDERFVALKPPSTQYEMTKLKAQRLVVKAAANDIDAVVVLPTRIFGPGPKRESNSVTKIIKLYHSGWWRFLPGNGMSIGNYVFVDDVVSGHIAALHRGVSGELYILGGLNLSFNELFSRLADVTGKQRWLIPIPISVLRLVASFEKTKASLTGIGPLLTPEFVAKYSSNCQISSEKAQRELGYKTTPFEDAVKKSLAIGFED